MVSSGKSSVLLLVILFLSLYFFFPIFPFHSLVVLSFIMSKPEKTTVCSPKVLLDAAQEKDIRDLANIVSMVKSRTRRPRRKQKKQDSDRIPRPMNCFMAYRLEKQKEIVARCPGANHRDISKVVAKWWRRESENVKQKYRNIAEKAKQQHSIT